MICFSVVKGEVDKWSERVYTASQMIGAEHFKDAVGDRHVAPLGYIILIPESGIKHHNPNS
jgi:hypothetical protein